MVWQIMMSVWECKQGADMGRFEGYRQFSPRSQQMFRDRKRKQRDMEETCSMDAMHVSAGVHSAHSIRLSLCVSCLPAGGWPLFSLPHHPHVPQPPPPPPSQ